MFSDLYKLIKNFQAKERLMGESKRLGMDYRVLTLPTLKLFLELKKNEDEIPDLPWESVICSGGWGAIL